MKVRRTGVTYRYTHADVAQGQVFTEHPNTAPLLKVADHNAVNLETGQMQQYRSTRRVFEIYPDAEVIY